MHDGQILDKIRKQINNRKPDMFVPGETYIPPSGKLVDGDDIALAVEALFDNHFTEGRFAKEFEKDLRAVYKNKIRSVSLCNSGSSANLLAVTTITDAVFGDKSAKPNDEIITVAAGFPTTVNPIVQNRLTPVFVDVDLDTFLPNTDIIENAIVKGITKGIILAHPLGNPFDAEVIKDICEEYDIWFIEDCCDGLGSTLNGKLVGSYGDVSTLSFYPAHQITSGEGGAILTSSPMLEKIVNSFRDWGRDCWCDTGKENTCGKRFGWEVDGLPEGYDHKYIYSRIGYNLKITDMQAAMLVGQLRKLYSFTEKRQANWLKLYEGLEKYNKYLRFQKHIKGALPSFFGFAITVKETAPFNRNDIVSFLTEKKIGTRNLFAGNITKQPAYKHVHYKEFEELVNTNVIMRDTFFIGVQPALTNEMLDYVIKSFKEFMDKYK